MNIEGTDTYEHNAGRHKYGNLKIVETFSDAPRVGTKEHLLKGEPTTEMKL